MLGIDSITYILARAFLWVAPLGTEVNAFARWVETSLAYDRGGSLRIVLEGGGPRVLGDHDHPVIERWKRLWRFLDSVGVKAVELDARLESNQVADVLTLLFAQRRCMRGSPGRETTESVKLLRSAQGLSFACTVVRLDSGRLIVTYSYCMTRFSALVRWFKERQTHLRDHRALFRAAPRYAAVVGLAPLVVFLLYAFHESRPLLLVTSLFGSVLMVGATYLFFMIVGSVEYDNEEQAHSLQQAYGQLKLYADHTRADLDRARSIQQRLLPDPRNMPIADHLEWATGFEPQSEVGGDYLDVAVTKEGRVAIIFADVSGHGLGAALITVILKSSFESWLESGEGISDLVLLLNRRLAELTPDRSFAAVAVGIYDRECGTFSYCNCGHSPRPYLIAALDGRPRPLDGAQTMILGVVPEISPKSATVKLERGDTVFFATDGITEARNANGDEYELERLEQFLLEHSGALLPELVGRLLSEIRRFSAGCDQSDDRAVLAFRVR